MFCFAPFQIIFGQGVVPVIFYAESCSPKMLLNLSYFKSYKFNPTTDLVLSLAK